MTQPFDPKAAEITSKATGAQPPALYGSEEHIASLVRRARFMIKGAEAAPDATIWRACQIAVIHHLDLFTGDLWLYPAYDGAQDDEDWIVDIGISAWRRAAQRQAKYNPLFTLLSAEECAARIGPMYTSEDVGVCCQLYRLDIARECKALGLPYEPTVAYGFWRKNARKKRNSDTWIPDQLAHTETKADKAQKRAEKKALKIAFSLGYPDDAVTTTGQWSVIDDLEHKLTTEERLRMPVADRIDYTQPDWDIFMQ